MLITTHPAATSVTVGQPATFTVQASGDSLRYQWKRNGFDIPGATNASYTLQNTVITDNGDKFRVVVSNAGGDALSNDATLTVTVTAVDLPVILTQPVPVS